MKALKIIFWSIIMSVISMGGVSAQLVSGTDTLSKVDGVWEYYDITAQTAFTIEDTTMYTPDFRGSSNEGVNFGQEFSQIIPGHRLLLLGQGDIDTVSVVPEWTDAAPWIDTSWDFSNGTQGSPISVGQLWVVYTSEGLYAVMEITALPDGSSGDSFVFNYKFMGEGGTTFPVDNTPQQIAGSATSSFGTGFDFSTQTVGDNEDETDYELDFAFVSNEGVNFGNEGSQSLAETGRRFLLLGTGDLDTLSVVPERVDAEPWITVSWQGSGTNGQPISVGQLWAVYTREGHYAVMEITGLPDGNFGNSFTFDYKYQPDGSRSFDGTVIEPEPEYTLLLSSGDNQTIPLTSNTPEPLVTTVIDENQDPVSGQEVLFEFFSVPDGAVDYGNIEFSVISDANGNASTTATVGDLEGPYTILATLASDTSKTVLFTINAEDTSSVSDEELTGTASVSGFQGFDFSTQKRYDNEDGWEYEVDFGYVNNEGVNFGNEGSSSLSGTGRRYLYLGMGDVDTVTTVPERVDAAPWVDVSYDFADGTGGTSISVGELWAVFTREGHYAVMEITEVDNDEGFFSFQYRYQPDGTRFFEGGDVTTDPVPTNLIYVAGTNQSALPGDTTGIPLEVMVTDQDDNPMSLITVKYDLEMKPDDATDGSFVTVDGIMLNITSSFEGTARMNYILGSKPGQYVIKAHLPDYPEVDSVMFNITGNTLPAPRGFTAEAGAGHVQLSWSAVEGAAAYSIYRSENDDNPESASFLNYSEEIAYSDNSVTPGTTYFYWVASVDPFLNEGEFKSGPVMATPTDIPEPVYGEATIVALQGSGFTKEWQYFDFSAGFASSEADTSAYLADIRGTSNEGVNFGNEQAPQIEGSRIIRLEEGVLEDISSIPEWTNEDPWIAVTWEWPNGTGGAPVEEGQLWGIYTREGNYAVMEITDVPEPFGDSLSFRYKYQTGGTPVFDDEGTTSEPDTMLAILGDGQVALPGATLGDPLAVLIVDEDTNAVSGITVNFNITGIPDGATGAQLSATSVITNEDGVAFTLLTLGDLLGNYEVTASANGLDNVVFVNTAAEAAPPEPVEIVEIRPRSESALIPIWTQSKEENFLRYRVYVSEDGDNFFLADSSRRDGFSVDTSRAIMELETLKEYYFAVTVVNNDMQESAFSNIMSDFPKPYPAMPENFTAIPGDGAVQLSWSPVDTTFFSYYLIFSRDSEGFLVSADTLFNANDTSIVIGGLNNGEQHSFVVNAENEFGLQGLSNFIQATPASAYEEQTIELPNLINGMSSWGDVDNDGDLDLLMTGQSEDGATPESHLFINNGDDSFSNSEQDIVGVINSSTFWYDIDQNGYMDLIISGESEEGPVTKVYLNNEGTLMDAGITLPLLADGVVAPGDFDNDGDLDFLLAGDAGSGPQTVLMEHLGGAEFAPVEFPFVGMVNASAMWGDANSDGLADLLIAGADADGNILTFLYINDGDGMFHVSESQFQGVINGTVAFTDLDSDADQDILITGYKDAAQTTLFTGLYENTGIDFELLYSTESGPGKSVAAAKAKSRAVVGDYDNDGDPDFLITAESMASVLKNNRGEITEEVLEIDASGSVTWADYDGDGDLDILATGGSETTILSNNTAIKNTAPTIPANPFAEVMTDTVKLSWNVSRDAQTPSKALTYNVRIGTASGLSDVLSANADLNTGKLRNLSSGNAGYDTEFILRNLPNGMYYWQVQAVDNAYLGSMFTEEMRFEVSNSAVSTELNAELPEQVDLSQNYPNPFNPSTNIEYKVPADAVVSLKVYDISGRLVATLVNQHMTAGAHTIRFDARNLASGLYIYRLQVGNEVINRKMTLIK